MRKFVRLRFWLYQRSIWVFPSFGLHFNLIGLWFMYWLQWLLCWKSMWHLDLIYFEYYIWSSLIQCNSRWVYRDWQLQLVDKVLASTRIYYWLTHRWYLRLDYIHYVVRLWRGRICWYLWSLCLKAVKRRVFLFEAGMFCIWVQRRGFPVCLEREHIAFRFLSLRMKRNYSRYNVNNCDR